MFKRAIKRLRPRWGIGSVSSSAVENSLPAASSKESFIQPELICHGDLVDVTAPFGGTLHPNALHPNAPKGVGPY
jgi:hypothetical protein